MGDLTLKSTFEGLKLAFFPPDIWFLLLDVLSFREVLLLSETGNKQVYKHVKSCLRHITLTRKQQAPRRISPTFLSSWNGLQELILDDIPKLPDGHYDIRVDMLPTTLTSLFMFLSPESLPEFFSPLSEPQATSSASSPFLPQLTALHIHAWYSADEISFRKTFYEPFGLWIQKLPLLSLNLDRIVFPPIIVNYMPQSLVKIVCNLGGLDLEEQHILRCFTSFTSLQTLHVRLNFATKWFEGLLPTSVTDLIISGSHEKENIWNHLPPHLVSLHIECQTRINVSTVSQLPRSLQSLTLHDIDLDAIPHLPPSLTTFNGDYINGSSLFPVDPSILPKSLQTLGLPLEMDAQNWKSLPRSLTSLITPSFAIHHADLEFVPHLPPQLCLLSLPNATLELVRALPCRQYLTQLYMDSGFPTILSALVDFPSLKELTIQFDCDITPLSQLCAPLERLGIPVKKDQLDEIKLPSSCFFTLQHLNIRYEPLWTDLGISPLPWKPLPWLSSLPASLTSLDFGNYPIHPLSLSNLPECCKFVNVAVHVDDFECSQLAHLPRSIHYLHIATQRREDDEEPLRTRLDTLLKSLPRKVMVFSFHGVRVEVLEPQSEWDDIMMQHLPFLPFLERFFVNHEKFTDLLSRARERQSRMLGYVLGT